MSAKFSTHILNHYNDVTMSAIASQITSLMIVYTIVYSGTDQRKHLSSASLAFVRGIHRHSPVNSQHKGPVTRKMFPFDDVIMQDIMAAAKWPLYKVDMPKASPAVVGMLAIAGTHGTPACFCHVSFTSTPLLCKEGLLGSLPRGQACDSFNDDFLSYRNNIHSFFSSLCLTLSLYGHIESSIVRRN